MSNRSYSKHSRRSGKKREIKATEAMLKLVYTSRIAINEELDTIYIYNGSEKPVQAPVNDDVNAMANVLEPKIMSVFRVSKGVVVEWLGLLGDEVLELINKTDEDEDEDQEKKRICYIHKYSKGIPLLESVIVNGKPYFIRMKKGGGLDFELLSEYETNTKILRPPQDIDSDNCKVYDFDSNEEITQYFRWASKLTDYPNMNFDKIFTLLNCVNG